MRIVSICPSNTELAAYLGLTSSLVGIDDYSDWPDEVQSLPKLGPDLDIDMDRVESLKPDLVLASLSVPGMEKNIERLNERNIPYHIFNPNTLEEIAEDLKTLGKLTGIEEHAAKVAAEFLKVIEKYRSISRTVTDRPSLYWEWWPKPVFTPGGQNWLTEISSLAGAENCFQDVDKASVESDWEYVRNREPDHVCLVWVGVQTKNVKPDLLWKRPNWDEMKALRNNNVHVLDEPFFCRPSPRLLIGLQKIAAILHPEKYPAFKLETEDPLLKS
ncbi:cobalamin-binding protein [Alkalihalobacillus sp. AL-G]|uniref:cobalamin-binding protein n=1 Tax=Alkalihalobacillus sp. AL-G TaxID=2926399 RepID=UPI0027299871|nr:cobalamin-binding protein [Alkalihalobacillus sp. AL-G]WLD92675.1 cobalamin-binding protein [Alkalihalobacillus sp. AL-G]